MATGAATLEPEVREAFERRYAPTLILNSYGATEFGGVVANITPQDRAQYGAADLGRATSGASRRAAFDSRASRRSTCFRRPTTWRR